MIIENQYGKVDFSIDFSVHKSIGLSFSGGCDSSLMLYFLLSMLRDLKPDVKIIPITGINLRKGKWKQFKSQEILDYYLIQMFPDMKHYFGDRLIHYITDQQELRDYTLSLQKDKITDLNLAALTCNPPYDVMEHNNLLHEREAGRDKTSVPFETHVTWINGYSYLPFRNIDKRWVSQCYQDFGLMEHIYPLTISCERLRETPELVESEEPCKHCWWCREKKMAFGTFDGGVE